MEKLISSAEDIDLNGLDLQRITKDATNIKTYHQLENVENIEEILSHKNNCIILYETKDNRGHWTSVFIRPENPKILEFFDPYGNPPDSQLKYAVYNLKNDKPYLTYLIKKWEDRGGKVVWNNHKLQAWRADVNTCGRWSASRILLKQYNKDEFASLFTSNRMYNPDFWVSAITYFQT
jgi:hypothetical protein